MGLRECKAPLWAREGGAADPLPMPGVCGFPLVFLAQNFSRSWFCPDEEQNKLQNKILGFWPAL